MVGAALTYELARRLTSPNWAIADEHARRIWALERTLHVAVERELQAALLPAPWLLRALSSFYLLGHFVLTALFLLWLYRRSRPEFARLRDALLLATAVALVVHWGFPTAPPRLAHLGVADTLRSLLGVDIGSPGHAALSNPVAAVPSLHAGYAVGIAIALWRTGSVFARTLAIAYPAAVLVTVVATGNHFLLDAVTGGAVVAVAYALQPGKSWLYFRLRRGVEQPGSSPGS
ncbi:MAG: hypothetical protein QOH73_2547 [Gaiellaceae bacterium]|nr:hypothetical protein [Gaiellaceae bacterium]